MYPGGSRVSTFQGSLYLVDLDGFNTLRRIRNLDSSKGALVENQIILRSIENSHFQKPRVSPKP